MRVSNEMIKTSTYSIGTRHFVLHECVGQKLLAFTGNVGVKLAEHHIALCHHIGSLIRYIGLNHTFTMINFVNCNSVWFFQCSYCRRQTLHTINIRRFNLHTGYCYKNLKPFFFQKIRAIYLRVSEERSIYHQFI